MVRSSGDCNSLLISDRVLRSHKVKLVGNAGWSGFQGNLAVLVPSGRREICESIYVTGPAKIGHVGSQNFTTF